MKRKRFFTVDDDDDEEDVVAASTLPKVPTPALKPAGAPPCPQSDRASLHIKQREFSLPRRPGATVARFTYHSQQSPPGEAAVAHSQHTQARRLLKKGAESPSEERLADAEPPEEEQLDLQPRRRARRPQKPTGNRFLRLVQRDRASKYDPAMPAASSEGATSSQEEGSWRESQSEAGASEADSLKGFITDGSEGETEEARSALAGPETQTAPVSCFKQQAGPQPVELLVTAKGLCVGRCSWTTGSSTLVTQRISSAPISCTWPRRSAFPRKLRQKLRI